MGVLGGKGGGGGGGGDWRLFFFPLRVHLFSARLIDSDQVKARRRWNGRKISSEGFSVQPAGQEKGSLCKGNVHVTVCVCGNCKRRNSQPVENALLLSEYAARTVNTTMSLSV